MLIGFLAILALMVSCSASKQERSDKRAQRKLAKLLKKHPEIAKSDTIMKDTVIKAPAIKDSVKAALKSDSGAINSIVDNAKLQIPDSSKQALKDSLNSFLENRERDTVITSDQGIKFRIKEKGNTISVEIEKPPSDIDIKYPQIINKITPAPKELSWIDQLKLKAGEILIYMGALLFLLLLLYIAWRIVKRKFFP